MMSNSTAPSPSQGGSSSAADASMTTVPLQYQEAGVFVLIFTIFLMERLFERVLRTSPLLGQLLAGILLGPALLNIVPHAQAFRFVGKLGVMMLVLESGLDTDTKRVVQYGLRSFLAALCGTVFPVAIAVFGAVIIFGASSFVGLAAGSAIAPTSLGFSAKLLGPAGLKTRLGSIIAIAAVVDDVLSLCLLQIVKALSDANTLWEYAKPAVASLGSIAVGVALVFVLKKCSLVDKIAAQRSDALLLFTMAAIVLFFSWSCAAVGSSDLLGCFLAGLTFSGSEYSRVAFEKNFGRLTKVGTALFFACTVGFGVPPLAAGGGLFSGAALSRGSWLLFAALFGKAFPLGLFASPLTVESFFKFSIAMQGRGEFSFLIADSAYSEGVLDKDWHGASIWAAFVASALAPLAFRYILRKEVDQTERNDETMRPDSMHNENMKIRNRDIHSGPHESEMSIEIHGSSRVLEL